MTEGPALDLELAAVAGVYAELARLRRAPDPPASVATLRALATELPGALRILDQMPLELLVARADAIDSVRGRGVGVPLPTWMQATLAWRRTMRSALAVRRAAARGRPDAEADASGGAGFGAIVRPPGGRHVAWALERLAAELGRPAEAIEREIFGPGRVSALERLGRR